MNYLKNLPFLFCAGCSLLLGGCVDLHHPDALYEEAPRPPFEKGRSDERNHRYADAEYHYLQITDEIVREMTLNQLTSSWQSVNANIIRAQEVVKQQPRLARARLELARQYYAKGFLCTRYLTEATGQYPREYILDELEFFYTASLEEAKTAIRLDPALAEPYLLIGEIYLTNKQRTKALQELKRLISAHPNYAKGYYALGTAYLEMKQYDKVERYFIRSIKLDPAFIDAYYMLGQFYVEQKWYDYAAYTFLEVLRRQPNDWPSFERLLDTCHELGKVYVTQGRYNSAIKIFQAVLNVNASYAVHQSLLDARRQKAEAALNAQEIAFQEATQPVPAFQPSQSALPEETPAFQPPVARPEFIEPRPAEIEMKEPPEESEPEEFFPGFEETPDNDIQPTEAAETLRTSPTGLSNRDVVQMIQRQGFHHPNNLANWGLAGTVQGTMQHAYQSQTLDQADVVIDEASGLTWQQSGSPQTMTWNDAKAYVAQLNQQQYGGLSDWRLPTIEELASLLEFHKRNNAYIDPAFDATQGFCWSADTVNTSNAAWAVAFQSGHVYYDALDRMNSVRAVR